MAESASLWALEIRPDVLSPFAILELQANALTEQTKGLLVGEVKLVHDEDKKRTFLNLDIVVPALDNYRRRILTATHDDNMIYPVQIDADCFRIRTDTDSPRLEVKMPPGAKSGGKLVNGAATDLEFQALVQKVLQSSEVVSIALSLIARAKDALNAKQRKAEQEAGSVAKDSE